MCEITTQATVERQGAVTFKGSPMTLIGETPKVGDPAPAFDLTGADMSHQGLKDVLAGGTRAALLIVVPSLDTSVCSREAATFNARVGELPGERIGVFVISRDTPFAQKRWAETEQAPNLTMLSDFREHVFGPAYGLLIKELGLLARSIFVVDKDGRVRYSQVVREVAQEPDYEAALAAANAGAR